MPLVFAFGTLKRGFPLHERGLAGATYMGLYRTRQRYPVLIAGPWFAPMMFNEPGDGLQIRGELYGVDNKTLAQLDRLESVGEAGNFRNVIELEAAGSTEICRAWCFMKARSLAHPLHSGYLDGYQDRRFIPPERRAP